MMVLVAVAALLFFGWSVYAAIRVAGDAYRETATDALEFDDRELRELIAEKRAALAAIKTSELDFDTGKVAEEDFEEVKASASEEAIEVMRRLDEVRARFRYQARVDRDLDALNRELATMAERTGPRSSDNGELWLSDEVSPEPEVLSPAARARRQMRQDEPGEGLARTCDTCGGALAIDDRFCSECGQSVRRTCAACGVELHSGAKFCHECGERTAARGNKL